ncbi:MAG: tRNA (guanosine(37)-N1)-methyltransferase TrmD [Firmicutes bacterium]|nr:tRNA (guanosine(37)-N1)-methyltransferase TrmD [Bacillota bacterium]
MKINILTIFPEMFAPLEVSMMGRAKKNGILEFNIVDIRQFSDNKHNKTDDYSFGGGQGMVFMPQPVFDAIKSLGEGGRKVYLSPRGPILNKEMAESLAGEEEITLLCGHYEGMDQRILDKWDFEEISIGDYILTGGELPAMVLIDVFSRLIPGVLSEEDSAYEESIYTGLLEYPQYTQPREFEGLEVPEVLLSGNHKAIRLWRFEESLRLTKEVRPELFKEYVKTHLAVEKKGSKTKLVDPSGELSKDELKVLENMAK